MLSLSALSGRRQRAEATQTAALVRLAELCGACPAGRSRQVAQAAIQLGLQIGMGRRRLGALAEAARLLDIGMAGLPLAVARRSRPLTADEEGDYRQHPLRSLQVVRDVGLPYEALNGILHHHERIDGRGFPMGLAGHEIPEFGRILAIADAFGRMTQPGSGRPGISAADALTELQGASGSHFDPLLVTAFTSAASCQPPAAPYGQRFPGAA
jgi:HD-GYP domain-containing protein (c-di-GMP phosphodiesterase class II)